ncbi:MULTISPECIES: hypothetical protein [Planktothricoides]|uniref:DUF948 domain-containing protein n=2 Tax=Planktothricoides raciborskii TaxID=132608 RepID=A0AAU8JC66_9CYAN|nr:MULTISPECIES: hypothetical protein [Planktothricoides]MBD2544339.1 DUF948 domain-containing protein [Planktothricoides raciborskii FACHB-1370]MBD2582186.1 DUF948 domain-containing protein [Planktothricoides raciborskii FACHB-1261]
MTDPLFWLGLSFLLVCVSIILLLLAALPALQSVGRAARSVEKLADTLARELPPTLQAIRLTGMEISDLTDDVNQGVQSAGKVVKQVDESISSAKKQAKRAQVSTQSLIVGVKAAWKTFRSLPSSSSGGSRSLERLPPSKRRPLDLRKKTSNQSNTSSSNQGAMDPYVDSFEESSQSYPSAEKSSRSINNASNQTDI